MSKKCTSCGREAISDFVEFSCPQCKKEKIVRCEKCRELTTEYTCKDCGFTGP